LNRNFFGAEWIHCNAKLDKVPKEKMLKICEREEKEEIIPSGVIIRIFIVFENGGVS
jgi:hypothetical protein